MTIDIYKLFKDESSILILSSKFILLLPKLIYFATDSSNVEGKTMSQEKITKLPCESESVQFDFVSKPKILKRSQTDSELNKTKFTTFSNHKVVKSINKQSQLSQSDKVNVSNQDFGKNVFNYLLVSLLKVVNIVFTWSLFVLRESIKWGQTWADMCENNYHYRP